MSLSGTGPQMVVSICPGLGWCPSCGTSVARYSSRGTDTIVPLYWHGLEIRPISRLNAVTGNLNLSRADTVGTGTGADTGLSGGVPCFAVCLYGLPTSVKVTNPPWSSKRTYAYGHQMVVVACAPCSVTHLCFWRADRAAGLHRMSSLTSVDPFTLVWTQEYLPLPWMRPQYARYFYASVSVCGSMDPNLCLGPHKKLSRLPLPIFWWRQQVCNVLLYTCCLLLHLPVTLTGQVRQDTRPIWAWSTGDRCPWLEPFGSDPIRLIGRQGGKAHLGLSGGQMSVTYTGTV